MRANATSSLRDGLIYAAILVATFLPARVGAQDGSGARYAATIAADLSFPTEATPPDALTRKMALLTPKGSGPFPAIVLVHQCAGLNVAILGHAREMVARGFVVMMIDSLGPRDVQSVCFGPRNGVNFFRGIRDAFQAGEHLRSLPMVDKTRVSLVGYSWGAMIGLMAASPQYRNWLGFQSSFAAIVSHYPGCFTINPPNGRSFEVFNRDADTPLLALLGADDTETPPDECERKFRDAPARETFNWKVYPHTTHCWDCKQIDGLQKIDVRGNKVSYRFDAAVSHDAMERTFAFLNRI